VGIATVAAQLPPAVTALSRGGAITLVALTLQLLLAIAFWSVVIPLGYRLRGLLAAGYVLLGGVFIRMPAMLLILLPHDIYASFHASAPSTIDPMTDQVVSGFILFAAVKLAIFTVFTVIFRAAFEDPGETHDGDDGGSEVAAPPDVPLWALRLSEGAPTVAEPAPETAAAER
jgi:hypothetical protein